jgi:hypothetical protein
LQAEHGDQRQERIAGDVGQHDAAARQPPGAGGEDKILPPGLGRLAQEAVAGRDTPLLLGIILTSAVLVIVINLLVDIAYAFFDPRVGASEASA